MHASSAAHQKCSNNRKRCHHGRRMFFHGEARSASWRTRLRSGSQFCRVGARLTAVIIVRVRRLAKVMLTMARKLLMRHLAENDTGHHHADADDQSRSI